MKGKILKKFQNIIIAVLTALLFVSFAGVSYALAKVSSISSLINLEVCKNVAKSKLYHFPEWQEANIGTSTTFYDLKDKPSAYMFKVVKDGKILGYIVTTAREDYFPIIELGLGVNTPVDKLDRCRQIAEQSTTGKLGNSRLLYLGGIDYLVTFPIEGTDENITIGLKSNLIYTKENLSRMQTLLDSRTNEQISGAEKSWRKIISPKRTPQPLQTEESKTLTGVEGYTWYRGYPPSAAGMLLNYYGTNTSPLGSYTALYHSPGQFTWYFPGTKTVLCYAPRGLVDELANYCGYPNRGGTATDYQKAEHADKIDEAIEYVTREYGYIFKTTVLGKAGPTNYIEGFKAEIDANRPFILGLGEEKVEPQLFAYTLAYGYRYKSAPDDEHYIKIYDSLLGDVWNGEILLENQYGVFALFASPPPIDTQPDEITVYRSFDDMIRQIPAEPVFKRGAEIYVTVQDGTTTSSSVGISTIVIEKLSEPKASITVTVRDDGLGYDRRDGDGIYTGKFNIDQLNLGNGQKAIITANLSQGTRDGSFTITAEYVSPAFIQPPAVSKGIFSPLLPPGTTTVIFTAYDDVPNGTWTYSITLDTGIIPSGAGSTGSCKGSATVLFDWNGKDSGSNILSEGTHIITVVIGDLAENFETKTTQVIIDTTTPLIENVSLSDYYFSPPSPEGTTTISFTGSDVYGTWSYILSVGTRTLCGSGTSVGTRTSKSQVVFEWNGLVKTDDSELLVDQGTHIITILLTDFVGNTISTSLSVKIDNTNPWTSPISLSRDIFSPQGIYPNTTISFTAGDVDSPWQYSILVDGQIPGGEGASTGTRASGTSSISFIWNGSPLSEGNHTVLVTITDFASNTICATTTVIIDTTKPTVTNLYTSDDYFSPPEPPQATVTITFTGNDNNGTWSYELKVDDETPGGVGTSTDTCFGNKTITFIWNGSPLGEGIHTVSVNVTDLAGNTKTLSISIVIDNTLPTIGSLTASEYYFSPGSSTGVKDTTNIYFTANDGLSPWVYSLLIGTKTLDGIGTPPGTQTGTSSITFQWYGTVMGTSLEAGQYNVLIVLTDEAGNTKTETISITIDNTAPTIITELSSTSYYFSPLNARGTPTFSFEANEENEIWYYEWLIGGKNPEGTATGTATGMSKIEFTWNGKDYNGNRYAEGTYLVEALLIDRAGNTRSTTTQITIDDTSPQFISPLKITPTKYSYNSPIWATITFTALDKGGGTWSYTIIIDGKEPGGIGFASSTCRGTQTVVFYWHGRDKEGFGFEDGNHTIQVTLKDILENTKVDTTFVELESTRPFIYSYNVSTYLFSPVGNKATNTTIKFSANDNTDKWFYELRVGTRTPAGWGDSTEGARKDLQAIVFTWNGRWMDNGTETLFDDGIYTFTIKVYDEMGNTVELPLQIKIDTTPPQIEGIEEDTAGIVRYSGERISFKLDANEEGDAAILLGTTTLESAEEVVSGAEFIRLDSGWNQFEIDNIGGWIEIIAIKLNLGTVTSHQFKIKDYITVGDLISAVNTAMTGIGTMTYSTSTDRFTITCGQNYRIIVNEYGVEAFHVPFFTSSKIPVGYVQLPDYRGSGVYKGYFEVPKMAVASSFDIFGYLIDSAGNWASNNGTYSHSIQLDGTKPVPVGNSRIIGLRVEPPAAATIVNTNKTQMTLSMVVAEIYDEPFEIIGVDMGTSSATINMRLKEGKTVDVGDTVIIWNDYIRDSKNIIYKDHSRVWSVKLPATNTVTIPYNSPYFGNIIGIESINSLKISNMHIITGTFTIGGMALVDIGILQTGVKLYDDGDEADHRDKVRNDGIYTGIYTVPPEIEVKDVPIITHYIAPDTTRVANDGYPFNDAEKIPFYYPEHDTDFSNNIYVEVDTIRPLVTLIGITSPFNPLKDKKAECKYRLLQSITASVKIQIKKGDIMIKDLGSQVANQGDNVFYWDGKDEEGNWVSDGVYRCYIDATDPAGNSTAETIYGDIKVTTVEIKIDELVLGVSMPTPKESKTIVDHLTVKIKSSIDASKSQLENLDFNLNRYSLFNKPYVLFNITVHDSSGKLIFNIGPDVTSVDSDPHLEVDDLPNYYIRPEDRIPPEGTNTILHHDPLPTPHELPEYGDHINNDYDTLVPFNRDDVEDETCKNYRANFTGGLKNIELNEGTYYVRVLAKLVAGEWLWAGNWERDTGNYPIGERWHFCPDYGHYGILSAVLEQRFELRIIQYNQTDHIAPVIWESLPANNEIVAPGQVKSGKGDMEHVVWVRITDNEQKVDFENSKITLKDAAGNPITGQPSHNGVDKLYWIIDEVKFPEGLTKPGEYFIEIKAMDKAANSKWETRKFIVQDKMPPEIISTSPIDQAVFGEFETIGMQFKATISEVDTGASGIDWEKSKILLFKDSVEITDHLTRYEPDKVNENYGTIKYSIASLSAGTYTMKVEVWDKSTTPSPNGGILKVITFYVTAENYIYVKLGALTYLSIPPMTWATCTPTGSGTLVGTTTITMGTTSDTPPAHEGLEPIEPIIEFLFEGKEGRIVFSREVILTMYYTDADVAKLQTLGLTEKDLTIYEADMQALPKPEWIKKITSQVDEQNNRIWLKFDKGTELKDKYAIMYSTPGDIVETFYIEEGKDKIKRAELRIKRGTTLQGNKIILDDTIVMDKGSDPGKHRDELGLDAVTPMIEFLVDNTLMNLSFSQLVDFWLYYRDSDYPTGTDEAKLTVYGYDGQSWSQLPISGSSTAYNQILIKTTYLPQIVAIMYPVKEVVPTLEAFKESVCAYPNPAKGGWVKFRYNLAKPSQITIKVYTILGDLVWEANYNDPPGGGIIHDWYCVNNAGKKIASGIYIYRLIANDGVQEVTVTKKLIVIQ